MPRARQGHTKKSIHSAAAATDVIQQRARKVTRMFQTSRWMTMLQLLMKAAGVSVMDFPIESARQHFSEKFVASMEAGYHRTGARIA